MKAHDRLLSEWFQELHRGSITLPRFQRFESWDFKRVDGLLNTILDGLPAGAALILNVDTREQFPSRPLSGHRRGRGFWPPRRGLLVPVSSSR